jgi:hypothetical protein
MASRMAVPAELIDACYLVGPADRIKDRLQRGTDAGAKGHVSSMLPACQQPDALGCRNRQPFFRAPQMSSA